jgi:hypothetical protein
MRMWVTLGLLVLAVLCVGGCKKTSVTAEANKQAAEMEAARTREAQQTEALQTTSQSIATISNLMAARSGGPDFKLDLAAARRLAGELSRFAGKQEAEAAGRTADRLVRCVAALVASAPANRIQQRIERAEGALTAGDMEAATGEVLAAAGEAYNPSAPALVPPVLNVLEDASQAARKGDANKVTELLATAMQKTSADNTATDLGAAHILALEARESASRKSWQVLIAQAAQIAAYLQQVQERAAPKAAPAEAAPQAEPQATPKAEPAATPETPAAPAEADTAKAGAAPTPPTTPSSTQSAAPKAGATETAR